ncbi:hypothetical protein EDEG_02920 [Edhazardia aedis USNM 41457]|uniref:Uncharacterized protein n=1 Tax=Edhazardia aedis (strain USNM 41457) TaxID=1003232 RepID=J8ZSQ1_EDHAE|nr:hypothetical protein EDEG_02920 [Edhazardia aedis USNM 41457]|eukprot:EJW02688.1 hypothetical protein EDEG_02920 [Edhazardia aedis USNM 41457]
MKDSLRIISSIKNSLDKYFKQKPDSMHRSVYENIISKLNKDIFKKYMETDAGREVSLKEEYESFTRKHFCCSSPKIDLCMNSSKCKEALEICREVYDIIMKKFTKYVASKCFCHSMCTRANNPACNKFFVELIQKTSYILLDKIKKLNVLNYIFKKINPAIFSFTSDLHYFYNCIEEHAEMTDSFPLKLQTMLNFLQQMHYIKHY